MIKSEPYAGGGFTYSLEFFSFFTSALARFEPIPTDKKPKSIFHLIHPTFLFKKLYVQVHLSSFG